MSRSLELRTGLCCSSWCSLLGGAGSHHSPAQHWKHRDPAQNYTCEANVQLLFHSKSNFL